MERRAYEHSIELGSEFDETEMADKSFAAGWADSAHPGKLWRNGDLSIFFYKESDRKYFLDLAEIFRDGRQQDFFLAHSQWCLWGQVLHELEEIRPVISVGFLSPLKRRTKNEPRLAVPSCHGRRWTG